MNQLIKSVVFILASFSFTAHAKPGQVKPLIKKSKSRVSRTIASAPNLSKQEQIVVDYLNCYNDEEQVLKLKKCVLAKMDKKLSRSQRDRLYSWPLVFGSRLMDFRLCSPDKKKEVTSFGLATPDYICANVEVNDAVKEVVFFMKEDLVSTYRIFSIYY